MKISIPVSQLSKVLSFVKLSLPKKDIEPVLKSILLRSLDKNTLLVSSTDLDLCSVTTTEIPILEEGEMLINGDKLLALVNRLPDQDLVIESREQEIMLTCGSYKGIFPIVSSEGYPEIKQIVEENKAAILPRIDFLYALKRLEFALCHEEVLKNLCCIEISPKGLVASDSKVTAVYREVFNLPENIYVSSNCVKDLIGVLDSADIEDVEIFCDDAYIVFRLAGSIFFTRRISCKFPDVHTKIVARTENNPILVSFRTKEFGEVVNRISLSAPEDTKAITIRQLNPTECLIATKSGAGFAAEETIEFNQTNFPDEDNFCLAYNFDYIRKVLGKFSQEEITFKFDRNIKVPTRIEDDKIVIFLMQTLVGE